MEFTFKDRLYQMKWRAQAKDKKEGEGLKKGATWCVDNPEKAGAIGTFGMAALAGTTKFIKHVSKQRAEAERMRRYYDPKTFNWVTCRRELTSKEKIEFSHRRENGESVTRILESMGLL